MSAKLKKVLSLMMTVLTLLCVFPMHNPANAANVVVVNDGGSSLTFPSLPTGKVCHFIAQTQSVINVYGNSKLTNKIGYIDDGDACRITIINSAYLKVTYPTSNGEKSGYVYPSDIFKVSRPANRFTSDLKIFGYEKSNSSDYYGYIAKNDVVYTCTEKDGRTLAMYPLANGNYKLAWFDTACYTSAKNGGWPTVTSTKHILFTADSTIKPIYSNSALTSTNSGWYIAPPDVCKIYAINSASLAVSYPKSDGSYTETRYIKKSAVLPDKPIESFKATKTAYVSLTRGGSTSSNRYIEPNDVVYCVKQDASYTQVIYPISGGCYRLAWLSNSKYEALKPENNNSSSGGDIPADVQAKINTYKTKVSNPNGTLVFLFEGKGSNPSSSARMNALCVVLKGGKVVYTNRNCTTLPDQPFNNMFNRDWVRDAEGRPLYLVNPSPMPTLCSGIHNIYAINHRGEFAALKVYPAKVIRYNSDTGNFYQDTSSAIHIHRRSNNNLSTDENKTPNSQGCQLIGKAGANSNDEYAKFIQAVGLVGSDSDGNKGVENYKEWDYIGQVIIDRSFAYTYLSAIGYSDAHINALNNPQ